MSVKEVESTAKRRLLCIARDAIRTHLTTGEFLVHPQEDGELGDVRATFVTLRNRTTRDLRGCRGEYRATRPLAQAVVHTAVAAATDDPRFASLTIDELSETHIEISVLTPMVPITPREIEIGRHGLLLTIGGAAGLFLPQVPVEQEWSVADYLRWLCRKAALPDDAWSREGAELFAFETDVWEEELA
jgi:AmmeMemoRadiSam system protein A